MVSPGAVPEVEGMELIVSPTSVITGSSSLASLEVAFLEHVSEYGVWGEHPVVPLQSDM